MSEQLTKLEINCETGEEVVSFLSEEEIATIEQNRQTSLIQRQEEEAAEAQRNALKESARAKLVSGEPLTEEEAALLVL
jgi:hypothetical protein